ncbi:sulfite exporter TauE/SafE family protein [Paenibacillus pinisoli]|uniref:Probable membrane transporter protein n=1 Tax=Paenibacillus pinisoli TaxID=1276110 RepID=A0A3A6PBF5_9BACL|nr:sulfite exporter TauE/SafE family protein [Paenibacillus pinisoli]RJX37160.1 sulfite exporter TauE/SafE family protein [Paenibacillus pinisoli]
MDHFLIFILIILAASILQTSTGFGFSIMATPFLLLLYQPQEAIQINIILSLVISASLIVRIRRDIDITLLKRFTLGSIAGVPLGLLILLSVDIGTFTLGISILLLALTALLVFNFKVKATGSRDYMVGGISGLLTTSIGMPGPPLLLYFTGTDAEKGKIRATTLAFYLFIYFVSLLTQIIFAGTNNRIWTASLYAIPVVFLGLLLGQLLFNKLNQRIFRVITYILLSGTGLYLLVDSLIKL